MAELAAAESSQPQKREHFIRPQHLKAFLHVHQRLTHQTQISKVPIPLGENEHSSTTCKPVPICCPRGRPVSPSLEDWALSVLGRRVHLTVLGIQLGTSAGCRLTPALSPGGTSPGIVPGDDAQGLGCSGGQDPPLPKLSLPRRHQADTHPPS